MALTPSRARLHVYKKNRNYSFAWLFQFEPLDGRIVRLKNRCLGRVQIKTLKILKKKTCLFAIFNSSEGNKQHNEAVFCSIIHCCLEEIRALTKANRVIGRTVMYKWSIICSRQKYHTIHLVSWYKL